MKDLGTTGNELIASGRWVERVLMRARMGADTYGLWNGVGIWDLTASLEIYGGVEYVGAGSLVQLREAAESGALEARTIVATLRATGGLGLEASILNDIEAMPWRLSRVDLFDAFLDPVTQALVCADRFFSGIWETSKIVDSRNKRRLEASLVSRTRDLTQRPARLRSQEDQQLISPGDTGLSFAHTEINKKYYLGGKPTENIR